MPFKQTYFPIHRLLEDETFEPRISWGLRMAIAAIVPVIWGLATHNILASSWVTLTAECICWVELKGSFTQRISILTVGMLLAMFFAALGTFTANYLTISVIAIFIVCFIAGLFKNLGDRGSGLALCVYVIFIVSNAYPVHDLTQLKHRTLLVMLGGIWAFVASTVGSLFIPLRQPYRRSIALIWKANAALLHAVAKGWDGVGLRNSMRIIYQKEKDVRTAMDSSLQLFENRSYQTDIFPAKEVELAKLRKITSLVGVDFTAISDELDRIKISALSEDLRLKIYGVLSNMQQVVNRMALYTADLNAASELLVRTAIDNAKKQMDSLSEANQEGHIYYQQINRVIQLLERSIRLLENGLVHLGQIVGDKPVYSSYSFMKTLYLLQPQRWIKNTRLLFNFNTLTARYILRSALAASVALFIYKWFDINHGYWLAFTVILVMQPYFGATLKKAFDRIIGTLAGGIAGGLLILLHDKFYIREIILFISFMYMVYFLRKNYMYAAFFITVSLVLLFDAEQVLDNNIIIMRALCTIGGAGLAIIAGFALLPDWDSKWLPKHIATAISNNYDYFITSFFSQEKSEWTKSKRLAETANSNAFDSFNRYLSEPSSRKRPTMSLYHVIMNNVRITRELNNIHIEEESLKAESIELMASREQHIREALDSFNKIMEQLQFLEDKSSISIQKNIEPTHRNYTTHQLFYIDKMIAELRSLHQHLTELIPFLEDKNL